MSTLKVSTVQLGNGAAQDNFLLEAPIPPNGTLTLKRGNGVPIFDVATDGTVFFGNVVGTRTALGAAVSLPVNGLFYKESPSDVAFIKTNPGEASVKAGTIVAIGNAVVNFASDTPITMPALVPGIDYAIWVREDGVVEASASHLAPPSAGNWRKIGGFHYAPGSNAFGFNSGGDITPQINEYSFWDLKFRPACKDPRGMTLVAGAFWADIYLLGVNHTIDGTSKYGVEIADGFAPPKIPLEFGGDGVASYPTFNMWDAGEVMAAHGKRLPDYREFSALSYGTTEATTSGGSDVPTAGMSALGASAPWNKFTSKWGVIQSTGCLWIWGSIFGGSAAPATWTDFTYGRGGTYQMENSVLFGGSWNFGTMAGSRCSEWGNAPTNSWNTIGARGVCNHLVSV